MDKNKINYIIDFLMTVSFIFVAISGLVIFFFLPSGVRQGGWQEFWGIEKNVWTDIHNWSGIVFVVLVLLHFILHWQWLVCMTKNIFSNEKEN
jgi:cytochrome b subunit of formate dehydrogenase